MKKDDFLALARLWAKEKKPYLKRSTYAAYSFIVHFYLLPCFPFAEDLTPSALREFALELIDRGLSSKTTRDIIQVAKMILDFKDLQSGRTPQPFRLRLPSCTLGHEVDVLTAEEETRLLDFISKDLNPRTFGIWLALTAGLRIGEVCALKWKDFDMRGMSISIERTVHRIYDYETGKSEVIVEKPKTRCSCRRIPIHAETAKMASTLSKNAIISEEYILTGEEKPADPATYRTWFKKYLARNGFRVVRFHSLRHTFATRCIESGCDPKTVSVLLGHSSVNITLNLYVHPGESSKRSVIDRMIRSVR